MRHHSLARLPRALALLLAVALTFAIAAPPPAPAAEAAPGGGGGSAKPAVFDSYEQLEACFRDMHVDATTERGSLRLLPSELIAHGIGNVVERVAFNEGLVGRKLFDIEKSGASKAELFIFGSGEVTFNGHPLELRLNREGGGWQLADIPGDWLKQGRNEVRFTTGTASVDLERTEPQFSEVSSDGGNTWQPAKGEFLVHLRLFRHPPRGVVMSDVIDLANPDNEPVIVPRVRVSAVAVEAQTQTPGGTAVALEARSGDTPRPRASWSAWADAALVRPARYVQWRATLTTDDPTQTPALESVTVTPTFADGAAPPPAKVTSFDSPRVVRSSWDFGFQKQSQNLAQLREQFKLDEVIAEGKTEMEQLVLLRNWVRRQWPHNDAGSGKRTWNALEILTSPGDERGMCVHFGVTFTQCALSLGFNARQVVLRNHYVSEAWSNELQKWVLMDVEAVQQEGWERYGTALYQDRMTQQPMSGLEIHKAVVHGRTGDIIQMYYMTDGADRHTLYERTYEPGEYVIYTLIGLPPRNNYLDQLEPWEVAHGEDHYHSRTYLWWRDDATAIAPEYDWHTSREGDFDWGLMQAEVTLTAGVSDEELTVDLDTVTPNFDAFVYRIDGGEWQTLAGEPERAEHVVDLGEEIMGPARTRDTEASRQASMAWKLKAGENRLEVKTRNTFGREGAVSVVVVER